MRIHSEAGWVTWEDVDWQRKEIIVLGNPATATKNSETRRVPMPPDAINAVFEADTEKRARHSRAYLASL
jgi:integrase